MNGAEDPESSVQTPESCSSLQPPAFPGLVHAPAVLLAIALTLAGLSLVMVYSTGGVLAERFGSPGRLLFLQSIWVGLGLAGLLAAARIDYRRYRRHGIALLAVTLLLLLAVLIPGVGTAYGGARRWIRFLGAGFQPAELSKLTLVIFMADRLAATQDRITEFKTGFLPLALAAGFAVALIAIEPDLGTALLIVAVLCAMLLAGGVRWRHLLPVGGLLVAGVGLLVAVRFDHVLARIQVWLNPAAHALGRGWQAHQSLVALGAGGPFGVGLGASQQKLHFLPEAHNDFILAIIGEELGLVGTGAVVLLFLAFLFQGLKIVNLSRSLYGSLLALGLVLTIALQAAMNIAVVTASIPTKGISLPMVSFGGSGTVIMMTAVGILISVARTEAARDRGSAGSLESVQHGAHSMEGPEHALL